MLRSGTLTTKRATAASTATSRTDRRRPTSRSRSLTTKWLRHRLRGSQIVDVENVDPVVDLTGPSPVAEGSTHTYSFTRPTPAARHVQPGRQTAARGTLRTTPSTRSTATAASTAASPTARAARPRQRDGHRRRRRLRLRHRSRHGQQRRPGRRRDRRRPVNEGSTHTYSYTTTDPGSDTFSTRRPTAATGSGPARHLQHRHRRRQLRVQFADDAEPARLERRPSPTPTARPDSDTIGRHGRQRRPDRHPQRADDLGQRGLDAHLQLHTSDPGADTFTPATDCGCDGGTLAGRRPSAPPPATAASTAASPTDPSHASTASA